MASSMPMPPGGMPGGGAPQQGPPPAFGGPSLANIPPGQPPTPPGQDPSQAGGALPRLIFQIEQQIETLAKALPSDASDKLNSIREQLREVVAGALSGGPPQQGSQSGGPY